MSNENISPADTVGTGWRISSNSGRKWFRIQSGSPEFLEWMKYFRQNGKQDFASFAMKHGHTFVLGVNPLDRNYGPAQINFMNAQNEGR